MLSREDNERLTRVGAGTPMGELMRRYWIPAAFSKAIAEPDCAPIRVRLMGENLVLFRDTQGRVGLLGERCPHRTASLFFGRNEQSGLRCVYARRNSHAQGCGAALPWGRAGATGRGPRSGGGRGATARPCGDPRGRLRPYGGPPERPPRFPPPEWTKVPAPHRFSTR